MTLISQSAGIILVNVALQVTLLTGLLLVILRVLRGKAAWRYQLAFWGMAAVLVLALTSAWMQSRQFNLFSMQLPVHSMVVRDVPASTAAAVVDSTGSDFEAVPDPRASIDQLLSGMLNLFYAEKEQAQQGQQQANWFPLLLVAIWLSGALWKLLSIAVSARSLVTLIRNSVIPQKAQQQRLARITHEISGEQPVFLLSDALHSPVHVGYLTPKIILPTGMLEECDDQKIRAVLLHELAHWQRRDNIANLLQQCIVAVFWFHPFIYQLSHIASRSREELCDNYVLAQQDPVNYCETLLWLSTRANSIVTNSHKDYSAAVAMYSNHWNLEQRICELIDNNRETTMTLSKTCQTSLKVALLGFTLLVASVSLLPGMSQVQAQDTADSQSPNDSDTRAAPPARDAETLSESVFTAITQVQELMAQPQGDDSANLIEAKSLLDDLYDAEFEDANSFEKATILNFYTNYHLMREDYVEALAAFEQILTVDGLRDDIELRTLRSLGQLYAAEERWQNSLTAFAQWRELSDEEDALVWRGLSYGNYQLDQWQEARDFWLQYLATQDASETSRDDYAYLNGLHFQLEDWQSALALTQDMIVRFNEQRDWDNLRVLYERLDDQNALADIDPELGSTLDVDAPEPQIAFANVVPTDGDYIPLLASAPMYPRVAADERIEGWVLVEFTVGSDGQVEQESVSVVDAEPAEVFNASSLRAAREFVFAPRVVAGEPVPVPGVQYLFRFRLGDDDA